MAAAQGGAWASLFVVADADKDGVVNKEEGFKFFSRFDKPTEMLERIWTALVSGDSPGIIGPFP